MQYRHSFCGWGNSMSTWYDIKLATLQKMFAADSTIQADESTNGYIAAMPYAANEGLQLLATAGKFITKSVTIVHQPIANILPDATAFKIHQITEGSQVFETEGARSYYFECSGKGSCTIYVDDELEDLIEIDSKTLFTVYKGLIDNDEKKKVKFVFETQYPMSIRNIALYRSTFETDDDVQVCRQKVPYDMTALVDDFYMIDPQGIYYQGDYDEYLQTSEFFQEGDKTLVLDKDKVGSFTIYYKAYPVQFTVETEDKYELPLDPEVVAILPLYMASQLYKDDDNGIATSYRNEFEVAFERLKNNVNNYAKEEFVSESGWI